MKGLGHSKGTSCRTPLAKILDPPLLNDMHTELWYDLLSCNNNNDRLTAFDPGQPG